MVMGGGTQKEEGGGHRHEVHLTGKRGRARCRGGGGSRQNNAELVHRIFRKNIVVVRAMVAIQNN